MKILSAEQIRAADQYTIQNEPISSINLMERASQAFGDCFVEKFTGNSPIKIFCGQGNNGGDGLCIARMLLEKNYSLEVFILKTGSPTSDFSTCLSNLERHSERGTSEESPNPKAVIKYIDSTKNFPPIDESDLVIDALFGSGLNRPIEDLAAQLIEHINQSNAKVIAVDIPSGLFADKQSAGSIIKAKHTFTFELPKLSFMFPSSYEFVGEWEMKSIGLSEEFIDKAETKNFYFTPADAKALLKPREKFSHKGSFGHALIVAGSEGKMGAAVLAARAALKTGCGLVTVHVPKSELNAMLDVLPEAMIQADENEQITTSINAEEKFSAIGIGPGLGENELTAEAIKQFNNQTGQPTVFDADALNLIGKNNLPIPKNSVITPHPKEFERLFGKTENDWQRNELQRKKAMELGIYIVLKGAHTCVATPEGDCHFNSTGNPGMAKGGSGDVLTGMITSLLAQGYSPKDAAIFGVYLHGLAGDFAAQIAGNESMLASDIIENIQTAYDFVKA